MSEMITPLTLIQKNLNHISNRLFDFIVIIILSLLAANSHSYLQTWQRPFRLDDPDISYNNQPNIVSSLMLSLVSILIPLIAISLILGTMALFNWKRKASSSSSSTPKPRTLLWMYYAFFTGFAISLLLTEVSTTIIKHQVGRLRPDFLDRCQPKFNSNTNQSIATIINADFQITPIVTTIFYNQSICTGDASLIAEGRLSFPSGHSSVAFSGLGFFGLSLFTIIKPTSITYKKLTFLTGNAVRLFCLFGCLMSAGYIAMTRVDQNVHNPTDVIAGGLLGFGFALLTWYLYIVKEIQLVNRTERRNEVYERVCERITMMENGMIERSSFHGL